MIKVKVKDSTKKKACRDGMLNADYGNRYREC